MGSHAALLTFSLILVTRGFGDIFRVNLKKFSTNSRVVGDLRGIHYSMDANIFDA